MPKTLRASRIVEWGRVKGHAGQAAPIEVVWAKNVSGGALTRGQVVISAGASFTFTDLAVTTTTTRNDERVVGMVYDPSIGDDAWGRIQFFGPTKHLKVNGTDNITVGARLSTYTVAGIAGLPSATEGRFAIALQAYSTNDSNGVIEAFISNRGFLTRDG